MENTIKINVQNINITKLEPMNTREINFEKDYRFKKLFSSIKTIGLIEPLCVFKENDKYVILDGFIRFKALEKLGIEYIPCMISECKEGYTYNRMVNKLSPVQEHKMLKHTSEYVPEKTIAEVFGLKSVTYRLPNWVMKRLHPEVFKVFDKDKINRKCAEELVNVKPIRQLEILKEMKGTGDYSYAFACALILKTPNNLLRQKALTRQKKQVSDRRYDLVEKLQEAEKNHDFYSRLYRQYSTDLLKLCIYIRKLIENDKIKEYLQEKYPDILETFNKIIS